MSGWRSGRCGRGGGRYHRDLARNPARTALQRKRFQRRLVHHIRDPHNLTAAAHRVQREGGASVGPDGVDIGAFTPAELSAPTTAEYPPPPRSVRLRKGNVA
jgi:hypothetical protein